MIRGILTIIAATAIAGVPMATGGDLGRRPLAVAEIETVTAPAKCQEAHEIAAYGVLCNAGGFTIRNDIAETPAPSTTADGWQYYGVCTITHYCPCEKCCGKWASGYTASGTLATANRTVAMDLPFGTHVLINGQEYIVEDRGVGGMWVDIFVNSHEEAYARGMYDAEVWIR